MSSTTVTETRTSRPDSKQSWHDQRRLSADASRSQQSFQLTSISNPRDNNEEIIDGDLPPPSTAVDALERWNHPRSNIFATFATYFSFLILGMNDASAGALIPYLEKYYDLTYTIVSLIFLSPFVGYSVAALLNNSVHRKFGQRGIAFLASLSHIITYLTASLHPPYPVLVVFFILAGFGNGLSDAAWCAWTGNMASANKVHGILQSFYSLGATISPLIITSMITKAHLPWYTWYYVMTAASVLEMIGCTWAFRHKTGERYRTDNPKTNEGKGTREALKQKVTWICSFYFMAYVGAEVALGGWIVTFMLRVRDASAYASGISATGFWAGMTVGRAILGFVTEKFGERISVIVYLAACVALELIFWLIPKFVVSAVAVAFLGFFLGPLFPAGVVMCAKLLPRRLHVSALGFSTAIGGTGAAFIPFAVGAIASVKGVQVLQPIILAMLAVISALWLSLPRVKKASSA